MTAWLGICQTNPGQLLCKHQAAGCTFRSEPPIITLIQMDCPPRPFNSRELWV